MSFHPLSARQTKHHLALELATLFSEDVYCRSKTPRVRYIDAKVLDEQQLLRMAKNIRASSLETLNFAEYVSG